jgi:methionyl-tRNA formyltransferase
VRPIGPDDSSDAVEHDLAALGAALLVQTVDRLAEGGVAEVLQNDSLATYAPRLTKEEGLIDFGRPAREIHNRIRGLRPWPGAYTFLAGSRLTLIRARLSDRQVEPSDAGTCVEVSSAGITIACGDGAAIDILDLQPEGRRVMTARDYAAGHGALVGRRFG